MYSNRGRSNWNANSQRRELTAIKDFSDVVGNGLTSTFRKVTTFTWFADFSDRLHTSLPWFYILQNLENYYVYEKVFQTKLFYTGFSITVSSLHFCLYVPGLLAPMKTNVVHESKTFRKKRYFEAPHLSHVQILTQTLWEEW